MRYIYHEYSPIISCSEYLYKFDAQNIHQNKRSPLKQICYILVHFRDFHDNPFIVKECSIKFPAKACLRLKISRGLIFQP